MTEQPLTDAELDGMEARCNAATPGPWDARPGTYKVYIGSANDDLTFSLQYLHPSDGRRTFAEEDGEFIAAVRTDMPRLLCDLRAARKALREIAERMTLPMPSNHMAEYRRIDAIACAALPREAVVDNALPCDDTYEDTLIPPDDEGGK